MHHKRHKPKQQRAGCLHCKPHKLPVRHKGERVKARKLAFLFESRAYA